MKIEQLLISLLMLMISSLSTIASAAEARGVIKASSQLTVSAQLASRITRLPYNNGDYFKKGQLLTGLDCNMHKAQRKVTEAQLKAAKATLANNIKLQKLRSIGELDVVIAQTEVDRRQAEIKMTDLNIRRCSIIAPWNGYVIERHANLYENIEVAQPIMDVIAADDLQLELIIPADWLSWIKTGSRFSFHVDETGEQINGSITRLGKIVDPSSHTLLVRAALNKTGKLLSGMSGTAVFSSPETKKAQ